VLVFTNGVFIQPALTLLLEPGILFSKSQGRNHSPVTGDIFALQVVQQPSALPYQFEQAPSGMMIFLMDLEMFVKVIDPLRQQGNLDFRRSCV
jgi:hypothetical protein